MVSTRGDVCEVIGENDIAQWARKHPGHAYWISPVGEIEADLRGCVDGRFIYKERI